MPMQDQATSAIAVICALACAVGIVVFCGVLAACAGESKTSSAAADTVAAVVEGVEIRESEVTAKIAEMRRAIGCEGDAEWAAYLHDTGMTAAGMRESAIRGMSETIIDENHAEELGVTVTDEAVDEQVRMAREAYGTEEGWQEMLDSMGCADEAAYRESVREQMVFEGVTQHFIGKAEPTQAALDEAAVLYAQYNDGSKRVSRICIAIEDPESADARAKALAKAEEARAAVEAGEMTFEEAVAKYSDPGTSLDATGDVGWTAEGAVSDDGAAAVRGLSVGELSEPLVTEFSVEVFKVTDALPLPDQVNGIKDLPEGLQEGIRESAKSNAGYADYIAWLDGRTAEAGIVINDMPEGLPYDVDPSDGGSSSGTSGKGNE